MVGFRFVCFTDSCWWLSVCFRCCGFIECLLRSSAYRVFCGVAEFLVLLDLLVVLVGCLCVCWLLIVFSVGFTILALRFCLGFTSLVCA